MARCFSDKSLVKERFSDDGLAPKEATQQFSKRPVADNHGDLPFGEIPEPLKYVRPYSETMMPNGIRVVTESSPG
jgi:hypothetical protein